MSVVEDYLYKEAVKDGSIIPLSEALATDGLTDEKGNTITFDATDIFQTSMWKVGENHIPFKV